MGINLTRPSRNRKDPGVHRSLDALANGNACRERRSPGRLFFLKKPSWRMALPADDIMKRKNTSLRKKLHLALLGAALALGAPGMAIADNATIDTQQDEDVLASEPGDPIELDPIVAIGRMPASTVVLGSEVDTPDNRRVQDVLNGMPNILDNLGAGGLPTIRGIDGSASTEFNQSMLTGNQPRLNTLVDGVARPFKGRSVSAAALGGLWDVEAVEVARGPQSTTTGRSSLTGAVRVSTRDPIHEQEFALRTGWFNERGTVEGALMANLPLVEDQVALRFAAEGSNGENYIKITDHALSDDLNEEKYEHYRGKLLLTPDTLPDTELVLSVDQTKAQAAHLNRMDNWDADDLVKKANFDFIYDKEQTVYSAKLLQGLGEKMDLEVRVSYLDNDFKVDPRIYDPWRYVITTETTSAEALLHFEELSFIDKGMVGVAYEHQEDDVFNDGTGWYLDVDGKKKNYAIFGEIEAGIDGGWTAIAGGRFERDERRRHIDRDYLTIPRDQGGDEVSENAFSPKLGIRYDGADKYVAGYTYSEGWRPGGIDFSFSKDPLPITTFDSERLKNHEIWVRGNPLGRLSINGSVFYYVFEDMQLRGAAENEPCSTLSVGFSCFTGNIPEAKGYGMELDGQFAINDAWTISGGLGLLDTEVTDAGSIAPEYQGRGLSQSPNVTGNMALGWASSGFDARVRARHVGSFQQSHKVQDKNGRYYEETDAYTLVDFKVGYETKLHGTELRIDAWVENLTDKRYKLPSWQPEPVGVPGRPRTFGIAVTAEF
uniref:Outer membrane receptor proteins, mostly Fe transport n=1 Tax=Candidatus Kentrum sp. FW TaxID=2126338 RepID=A0A450TWN6_9GAMM|nr:MAG: Outer membrane receptor proteins, mostly Fe transport [Candidatus Kentron sp. FW]